MWLDTLNRRFGRLAIPHLPLLLVFGQVLFFLAGAGQPEKLTRLMWLDFGRIFEYGEAWRLVSFLFIPPSTHPFFLLFAWYLFYIMGTALQTHWGAFRFTLYILIGWLATLAAAYVGWRFLPGGATAVASNSYLAGTVFLAFAAVFPDFEILLFFILPVKIKWLALLTWISYLLAFLFAVRWTERLSILAAAANYLLFFGPALLTRMRQANRHMVFQAKAAPPDERQLRHVCRVCGANDVANPEMDFRYCTDCRPAQCYCPKHLDMHAHTKETGV